ncbi:hypothetical protein MNEG_2602 [Monoraphidium neglectum]|uniref:Uncharacterized protein n=1 Tax=Monoraphidium neglectum TaxID=145388 RepID=A0A0D2LFD2_9CHLO|nr:hypothetical protein MNEG_2602 [Monoraphidium neglectum]KIZ05354.1 hypothetical protein MNEG_2602 [Monoraphidium neglectum]|eukprot:XP_013904373.1 hypothetical protein MNEG_2602 [Monoraphidium neglectum]
MMQTHHPGWEVRYWDDRSVLSLIKSDFAFFLPTFKSYKQVVQRSDAARWLILYKFGGVYIDNDVECYRSMEPSIKGLDLAVNCELEAPAGKVGNAVLASAPGNPLWLRIIREGIKRAANVKPGAPVEETLDVTGPHITEWGIKTTHGLGMEAEVCGIPLTDSDGRKTYAFKMGEWFTPCRWNNHTCHMEWARKSFYARSIAAPPGSQGSHAPGSVVGMHMYASSWTNDMSATAQRMRQQARESLDEASKFLSDPLKFVEYRCLDPLRLPASTPGNVTPSPAPSASGGRLLVCGEFVEDAIKGGTCTVVTMAGQPHLADFEAEATLRRLGCRVTAFTPGGDLPVALQAAAPAGQGGESFAPATHALRMAAAAKHNGGARLAPTDGDVILEEDAADPAALMAAAAAAARHPPARHTLLHISCGGCEWDTFHAMFQHATLSGDALDHIETLLLDTPGPVPSDHRALSLYALLYQVHGFVGFTHHRLPNGQIRLGWVRAPWRAAVRAAVLGRAGGDGRPSASA